MRATPYDIKREFTRLCGEDVVFVETKMTGRALMVRFTVSGLDDRYWVSAEMKNGTSFEQRRATMVCAKRALEWAYNATGERDLDMQQLLNGNKNLKGVFHGRR